MERHIEAERIELVINLFGSFDENVRLIEKELDVAVINRGSEIKIGGEPENVVVRVRERVVVGNQFAEHRGVGHGQTPLTSIV